MTYKIKIHYGNGHWFSTNALGIPTKDDLKEELIGYQAKSNMATTEVMQTLAVIEQCKIPQTLDPKYGGTEYCNVGFITIVEM